ncbi:alpha/beta hydrolase [Roseovarius aestuarii]|uniref:Alpha/beta hydrolase family protein n=1 Tax=Roseovarius aestuarii TaxID=475083 RepID=A0A1X7BKV3_9RHOB|nr:alpha/beta fold hydrolase [Roseovarius aestuarii]SMC10286.1 Alpha/beta hydrolase family protein [Roseovarius aestuarii]
MFDMGRVSAIKRARLQAVLVFCLLSVVACTPRYAAKHGQPHPSATIQSIYVATTRSLDDTGPAFGAARAKKLNYFRADISVPPTHEVGQIEWAKNAPDARTDFLLTDTLRFGNAGAMARSVQRATPGNETMVFVPGYNNTLSEAMYRLAQIRTDFDQGNPAVLFSWPSAGDPRGYVYDRDSVLFARDDLEHVLQSLTAAPGEKVFLLAHSVGSHLTMEVLRQAALRGDRRLLNRIGGVVLMSPDIDPDLFRRQAEAIGKLPQPFLIFTSQQDRALGLSALLSGRKPRLGVVDSPEAVEGLGVRVVDFSEVSDGKGLNHIVPVTSPAAVQLLKGLISQSERQGRWMNDFIVLHKQP